MPNKDDKSGSRSVGISNSPDLERSVPDTGKDESETNESLMGNEIPEFDEPEKPDEGYVKINNVGGNEEEEDDDDDDDDDDLDDVDEADEDISDISDIDDEDIDDDDDDDDLDDVDEEEIDEEDTRGLNPGAGTKIKLKWDSGKGKGE